MINLIFECTVCVFTNLNYIKDLISSPLGLGQGVCSCFLGYYNNHYINFAPTELQSFHIADSTEMLLLRSYVLMPRRGNIFVDDIFLKERKPRRGGI